MLYYPKISLQFVLEPNRLDEKWEDQNHPFQRSGQDSPRQRGTA